MEVDNIPAISSVNIQNYAIENMIYLQKYIQTGISDILTKLKLKLAKYYKIKPF